MANPQDLYPLTAEKLDSLILEVVVPDPEVIWIGLSDKTGENTYYDLNISVKQANSLIEKLTAIVRSVNV